MPYSFNPFTGNLDYYEYPTVVDGGEEATYVAPPWSATSVHGCTLWLRSDLGAYQDAAKTIECTGGDKVYTWADQSGNGVDVSQSDADHRPVWTSNQLNTQPILGVAYLDAYYHGDAGLYNESVTNLKLFPNAGELCMILVVRDMKDWGIGNSYTVGWSGGGDQVVVLASVGGQIYFDAPYSSGNGRSNVAIPALWAQAWHIVVCYRKTDGTQVIRVDQTNLSSVSKTGNVPSGTGTLGIFNDGVKGMVHKGDLAEVIFYDNAISTDDLATVETYLKTRYGI